MSVYRSNAGRLGRAVKPTAEIVTVPASVGGVNALDALIAMPPQDCIYTYNIMPSEDGLRLRRGYAEWATGVGTTHTEVRSILPFEGKSVSNDKLFAVTADGIYDITSSGDTGATAPVEAFSNNGNDAGYMVWTEMTLDTAVQVMFAACPENGLRMWTEGVGWTTPSFTGPTVANIAYAAVHKQRLWTVEKGSADAWYSPIDSIAGAMTKFTFGAKFTYGGALMGLWSWTIDGGAGVDDFLVAISRGGDVLVFQGSDPSLADFALVGSWFIGEVPDSRKIVSQYGGEMYILSTFGVTSLRDLLQGVSADSAKASASAKINRALREQVVSKKSTYGWSIQNYPADGFLQVIEPYTVATAALQYNQNLLTKAWGYWESVPAKCADTWADKYFIGSSDGKVFQYTGTLDNTTLSAAGEAIPFRTLTSFQAQGNHGTNTAVGLIRVLSTAAGQSTYNLKAVYDYNIYDTAGYPASATSAGGSLWDAAKWDAGVWDAPIAGEHVLQGGNDMGRVVAIAMRGESKSRMTVLGWDVTIKKGGFF